jgi:uncharacterized surface protein with fasciclin (FAS1) repeats
MKKSIATTAATALTALALGVGAGVPAQAAPQARAAGSKSLVQVLGADGTKLDKSWADFDILEQAVLAVLAAKPDSPVGLLADGNVRLTAFLPTDRAFQFLVKDLTGKVPGTEAKVLKRLLKLADVDTIETILLYHVVPGATLDSTKVLRAAAGGDKVTTAQGGTIKVHTIKGAVTLLDQDKDSRNPQAVPALLDVNKGNKQIGHGIDRVLRPLDL